MLTCWNRRCCTIRWWARSAPPMRSGRWWMSCWPRKLQWLPQYAHAIPAAIERLKTPKVKTRDWAGAARLEVRSVEELRAVGSKKKPAEGHGLGTKVMG